MSRLQMLTRKSLGLHECACGSTHVHCNPNRFPNSPWVRCYDCGALWDGQHNVLEGYYITAESCEEHRATCSGRLPLPCPICKEPS